jgi:hypothetical protein
MDQSFQSAVMDIDGDHLGAPPSSRCRGFAVAESPPQARSEPGSANGTAPHLFTSNDFHAFFN